ncbi:RHS repeat-associated core domain-containing protein [Prevotella sp. 20925_1_30]|uniref:RHS repeat-associated core domain-containing protein n=1 Tax=Prevotella sp. 20925_1_30 TaxID=3003679 RepID=UPI00352EDE06
MASVADIRTYVYGATYDSWNRVQTMTYPDGEVVTYHYNATGQVESMTSNKQGRQSVIVDRIGYDKEGHTVYTKLGNGTETTYTYDKQRERLQVMNLTADGQTVMENRYRYDAVDNILGITNAANPTSLTKLNKAKLGGRSSHTYEYDELNRLIHASGKAKRASYDMVMSFGRMSEPLTKVQKVDSTTTAKSYNFAYKYEDNNHPTAPTQIGHDHYTYDANGNPTLVTNDSANTTREMYWDEDNRLMVLSDNGKTSRYTYNAAGERIMKSYGTMEGVYINGAPQGITFHETDNFTLYPASILSVNKNRFTKHYFIGDKRIASRIGTGLFNNVYGRNGSYVTAGQQDYAERMNQIQTQKKAYYKKVGVAPGVPTEKGAYGDPENTGVGYNAVLTELGNHDVPQGWIQTPRPNTTPGTNPGAPVSWNDPSNPDDPQAGYGYIPNDTTKEETFFYHSDHLGSTSYITDDHANITQYDAYLPYGELLVDEHSSSENLPYKFNGKEMDEETGLYYYGARYMNPATSLFLNVDRFLEKYTSFTPYNYCGANPIGRIDLNGDTLSVVNKTGGFLFSLDDGTFLKSKIKASDLYKRGTQWFESTAENYMPLLSVNANIRKSESFKHFTWQDIIDFAEIDRSMLSYRSHGSGDWKAEGKPANGYLLVEIEGIPYWADAIGQIPFALNDYRNYYKNSFDSEYAERNTIADGAQFANSSLWNLIFPSYDYSNTYDNAMIKRAIAWAKHRYYKSVEHTYFLGIDFSNRVMKKNDYPANNMGVYILK